METLDIVILLVLAIGLLRGLRTGFLKQASSLVGTILAFVLAASFMASAGRLLELEVGVSQGLGPLVAFIMIFMVVKLSVHTVSKAAGSLLNSANLSGLDRVAGGLAGGVKAAVAMSIVFLIMGYAQLPGRSSREASELYSPVYRLVPDAWRYVSNHAPAFEELRRQVENRLDVGAESLPI